MLRNKRALFLILPMFAGLIYYNVKFFRERAERLASGPSIAPDPSAKATAKSAGPGVAIPEVTDRTPRGYEEALARLKTAPPDPSLSAPSRWGRRNVFDRFAPTPDVVVVQTPTPKAAAAAQGGTTTTIEGEGAAASPKQQLRFEGWVKTPKGEYAIVNGEMTRPGMTLPGSARVMSISRQGVVLATATGTRVLRLSSEVTPPRAAAPPTTESVPRSAP